MPERLAFMLVGSRAWLRGMAAWTHSQCCVETAWLAPGSAASCYTLHTCARCRQGQPWSVLVVRVTRAKVVQAPRDDAVSVY